jgi:hypothetical protein
VADATDIGERVAALPKVPPSARALATLRVDYEDCFLVDVPARERTAEEWARTVLEETPTATRAALRAGWGALGLQLGSDDAERLVLGWEVRDSSPDHALLAARSRLGFCGEVLFKRHRGKLLFATFVQLDTRTARATWAGASPGHRLVVRRLLEGAL